MVYSIFLRDGEIFIVEMTDYEEASGYKGMCVKEFYIPYNEKVDSYEEYNEVRKEVAFYAQKLATNGQIPLSSDAKDFINVIT